MLGFVALVLCLGFIWGFNEIVMFAYHLIGYDWLLGFEFVGVWVGRDSCLVLRCLGVVLGI